MREIGWMMLLFGLLLAGLGALLMLAGRLPFLGRLPGDIVWHGPRAQFYFPITTCILLSLLLTLVLNLIFRWFR